VLFGDGKLGEIRREFVKRASHFGALHRATVTGDNQLGIKLSERLHGSARG
jgi:hypothetical protein